MKKSKIYPWIVVALLWGVALLNYMDRQMLSTMQDYMKLDIAELNSGKYFGYLMGIFLWIYGLMSPISGFIADRLNRKWLIVGSLFVWSGVTFLMGYAGNFTQLFTLRAFMGISEALYIPAGLSLIADYHTGKTRSLAVGIHMTGLYTGQALGGFGATLADHVSWQTAFHWFGVVGIVYAVVLALFLYDIRRNEVPDVKKEQAAKTPGGNVFSALVRNGAFWVILLYFAVSSLPGWATKNWLPTLFAGNLDMDMAQAGPLSTFTIAISSFVGVIFGGILSDRWAGRNVRGRVYTCAIGLGLTVPSLYLLGFGHSIVALVMAGVIFGVGFGMFDANNMPILCQFVSSRHRATAYGVMNMVGVFSGAIVTTVLGSWKDNDNLGFGFAMLSIAVAIVVAAQLIFLRPKTDNMP